MTNNPFEIIWSPAARKALAKLPEKVGTAAIELIYGPVADNPYRLSKPLTLGLETIRAARRGDYRVLYRVDNDAHTVDIVTIEHRADAYRRR